MASKYYDKKFQDVKPDEKVELTDKERYINWWRYNWGKVALGVVLLGLIIFLIADIGFRVHPDYNVAYVGTHSLAAEKEEIEKALAQYGEDVNGDGRVVVRFNNYLMDESDAAYESYMISMLGDMSEGISEIFIFDDPEAFRETYNILEGAEHYLWTDCPALSEIDLGGRFYVARRTYETNGQREDNSHAEYLWNNMIAGVE